MKYNGDFLENIEAQDNQNGKWRLTFKIEQTETIFSLVEVSSTQARLVLKELPSNDQYDVSPLIIY